ncbi:glutathione S-transferase domain-containing protein [Colletotrichum camelliae]|nr:glutathione S-transferase domain-containing protein [Colletotrichum camelliae]
MATEEQPKIKLYWSAPPSSPIESTALIKTPRLNDSRAQNTLWLLEELNLSYTTEVFQRQSNKLAPPELAQVHPLGKSPVLEITPPNGGEPIKLAESGYITQSGRTARRAIGGETEAYARFQYLLHYVEGSFFPTLVQYLLFSALKSNNVPFLIRPITSVVVNKVMSLVLFPNAQKNLALLESYLKTAPGVPDGNGFLCGPELSAADILLSFGLTTADHLGAFDEMGTWEGGSERAAYPGVAAYIDRIKKEPGYLKAREKAKEIEGRK